jgi:ribose/xylose/arabinose/galactoside ABC-type transport system permease subunit
VIYFRLPGDHRDARHAEPLSRADLHHVGRPQIDRQYVPSALKAMSQTSPIFGIPWIIFMMFAVALLTYWFVMHTRMGRQIFALGSNPVARRSAGSTSRR